MSLLDGDDPCLIFDDIYSMDMDFSSDSDDMTDLLREDSEDSDSTPSYISSDTEAEAETDTTCTDKPELHQVIAQFPVPHVMNFKVFMEMSLPYYLTFMQLDYERAKSLGMDCSWESYLTMRQTSLGTFWMDQYRKYLSHFGCTLAKKNTCPKGMGPQGRLQNPNEHDNYDLKDSTTFQLFGWMKQKDRDKKLRELFNECKRSEEIQDEPLHEPVPHARETYARRRGPFYWWLDANWEVEWFRSLVFDIFAHE